MGDRFGASDAWLMFALWASANGHHWSATTGFVICGLYCFLPFGKPTAAAAVPTPEATHKEE